ncbi:MAG TPA: hypothetical protein VFP91_09155 [Vicinamibacterales bacterium]|nr:hypothetical protein [Vicinamibacterales bacterium]
MNLKARRRYDMLARVHAFGARRARAFPAHTLGGQMFAVVGKTVDELKEQAVEHMVRDRHARERTLAKRRARAKLLESLRAIQRTAKAMAIDAPGLDRKYRLPRSHGDRVLLSAAHACAQHARESAAAFVAHGMPAAFLDELAADIERAERLILDRAAAKSSRVAARASIDVTLRVGLIAVRRLEGIVPNVLRGKVASLTAWLRARRITRRTYSRQRVLSHQIGRSNASVRIRRVA